MDKQDAKHLYAHLSDLARQSMFRYESKYSMFLDPLEMEVASKAAFENGAESEFWGGYGEAERKICRFFEKDGKNEKTDWPICGIILEWNHKFGTVGHRDILGSLMSLGFERNVLGDIVLLNEDQAAVFVHSTVSEYLAGQIDRIGSVSVKARTADPSLISVPEPDWKERNETVSSLRLDSFTAAAFRLSRSEAQDAVKAGLLKLNHKPENRIDIRISEGDLFSLRGYGRAKFDQVLGISKKERIHIHILYTK